MTSLETAVPLVPRSVPELRRPRLGFLGVGWIGRHRLEAVVRSPLAEVAAMADASPEALAAAFGIAPGAATGGSLDDLLEQDLDGVVIATPSALHAGQAIACLERGLAVFCQKPLARTAAETRAVVDAARRADRLLAVDFSYRFVRGVPEMRRLIQAGALGRVFAAELTFHNAYGPDKPWFDDPQLAGGGCAIDLGIHLIDLALWMLPCGAPCRVASLHSRLFHQGRPLADPERTVEDYATAQWELHGETTVRLTCSWRLSAGRDAAIEAAFYGTEGAVSLRNMNGSFYDFVVERFTGTRRELLAAPPDDWGGRAVVDWAERLARGGRFQPEVERLIDVASILDAIYGR